MKNWLLVVMSLAAMSAAVAFGADQEVKRVLLDSKKITIDTDRALLVRTAQSPDVIRVHMEIPFGHTYCVRYETRWVWGADPSCGYTRECRQECGSTCEVWKDGSCVAYGHHCWESCYDVMLSCNHPEQFCAEYGVATSDSSKSFRLKFKHANELAAGEEETFEVQGRQSHTDGINDKYAFEVKSSKAPYTVRYVDFFGDWITVKGQK